MGGTRDTQGVWDLDRLILMLVVAVRSLQQSFLEGEKMPFGVQEIFSWRPTCPAWGR